MVSGFYDNKMRFHGRITSYPEEKFAWFNCECPHKKENHYWCEDLGEIKCETDTGFFRTCNCKIHYCEGTKIVKK